MPEFEYSFCWDDDWIVLYGKNRKEAFEKRPDYCNSKFLTLHSSTGYKNGFCYQDN
jgi:hypothetical protein